MAPNNAKAVRLRVQKLIAGCDKLSKDFEACFAVSPPTAIDWASPHGRHLKLAVQNFLGLGIVRSTIAQLLDGMPTRDVFVGQHWLPPDDLDIPAMAHHALCPDALETAQTFCEAED